MEQDFDFVTLFQILNEYKSDVNQNLFLTAFTGIIFQEIEDDSKQFKKVWKSEIENGGSISEDFAKEILRRKAQLTNKYRTWLKDYETVTDDIKMDTTDEIIANLDRDKIDFLDEQLRTIIRTTNNKTLLKEKDRLLEYEDFNTFLSELILFSARKLSKGTHKKKAKKKNNMIDFPKEKQQVNLEVIDDNQDFIASQIELFSQFDWSKVGIPPYRENGNIAKNGIIILPKFHKDGKETTKEDYLMIATHNEWITERNNLLKDKE